MKSKLNNIPCKLGHLLRDEKDNIRNLKNNNQLKDFLKGLNRESLDLEASDYLDNLIEDCNKESFTKNFYHIYNILLAGEGLGII